jgi:hypothetical protein
MKKLFVHLSLLCLLAALLVPMVGCGRSDEGNTAVEETTATTDMGMEPAPMAPDTTMGTDMGTDMGTGMGTDMGTDMGTGMGTGAATPPAQ